MGAGRDQEAMDLYYDESRTTRRVHPDFLPTLLYLGLEEEFVGTLRRWGESRGYPDPERLDLIFRATQNSELKQEAMALVKDLQRTEKAEPLELFNFWLLLDAPSETLRIIEEAEDARDVVFVHVGVGFRRYWGDKYPEVGAALEEAGIPVH
jgi:hypothetical protein